MKTMLEWARFYRDEWGACVIPLREGKHPAVKWAEFQKRRPAEAEITAWFGGDSPAWGMALVCGEVSGNLVRLDFDDPEDYSRLITNADPSLDLETLVQLRHAPVFRSQRKDGGWGIAFKNAWTARKVPGGNFAGYPKLELMGEGCLTVIPPTPGYEWLDGPLGLPTLDLPRMFLGHDLWRAESRAEGAPLDDEMNDLLENTARGGRDDALLRLVSMLRARNVGLEAIKKLVVPHALDWEHGDEPWDEAEIEKRIEDKYQRYEHEGSRYGPASEYGEEFDDTVEDYSAPQKEAGGPKPYLVDRLVMGEDMSNVVMAANSGEGKTTVCLGVALCMAQGRPVWGVLDVPRPLRVVFIDQEEVRSQIRETIDMMSEVYGRPKSGMLTGLSGKGNHYSIGNPRSLERLEKRLDKIRPDFVFLDGWQWFVDNKVSDRDFVGPALAWWKRIRGKYGCGTWIIHHNKKVGAPQFRPADPLELATGAKLLMDQARTKLIYEQLSGGYEDYGFLQGRCGRAEWNPIRIALEYDQTTQSHRMILREEGEGLFDSEQVTAIWGEREKSRKVKGVLNRLKRLGMNDSATAEFLGIGHSSVAQWRSGKSMPTKARLEQLESLLAELVKKRGSKSDIPATFLRHSPPTEFRQMPSPIGVPIDNIKEYVHVPRDTGQASNADQGTPLEGTAEEPDVTFEEL